MVTSDCFVNDNNVRNAWVALATAADKAKIHALSVDTRFAFYRDVDSRIKEKYLETLRELNTDLNVIHIRGFGPTRQSTNQQPLDLVMSGVAFDVLSEIGMMSE